VPEFVTPGPGASATWLAGARLASGRAAGGGFACARFAGDGFAADWPVVVVAGFRDAEVEMPATRPVAARNKCGGAASLANPT
jgi:hypothetical protein